MKTLEKNKAIELRKQGRTFSEILGKISVSKGSLSNWLKDINLTHEQLARVRYKNDKIKAKFIRFNRLRRKQANILKRLIFKNAHKQIKGISEKELKLIGIALYWAEGYRKTGWQSVSFTNSDPEMIKLIMKWFREICKVHENKFRIRVQCHGLEKVKGSQEYWSRITRVPLRQFTKPYIRISPSSKRKMGELTPYGICNIRISDISLLTKIKGWIEGFKGAIV